MPYRASLVFVVAMQFALHDGRAGLPPDFRTYTAMWTDTAPVIDGVISTGEWDSSQDTGDWRLLRDPSASVDLENNRFQIMWDNDFLYFMTTSEYGFWDVASGGDAIDFDRDNANLYLDPNLDGNANTANNDAYQIAWNQYEGAYSCSACTGDGTNQGEVGSGWGFFTEAHIGGLFGNQARWVGLQDTVGAMKNDSFGGVTELAIPWTDLNAPGTEDNPDTPDVDETNTSLDITRGGLDPGTPANGDEWFFNVARISSDAGNQLPAYNWTTSQFFAQHPHALLTFTGIGIPSCRRSFCAGDFDFDGDTDGDDFLIWQRNFPTESGASRFNGDANDDGAVNGDDFLIWQSEFGAGRGTGSATAVPEPSAFLLLIMLLLVRSTSRSRKSLLACDVWDA